MYYTLTCDIDSGGRCACVGAGGRWEISVLFNFFFKPIIALKNDLLRKFPGGPIVRTPCFHCQGHRFSPLWGN